MTSIKEMVANARKVRFTHYKNGELWYVTECGLHSPSPLPIPATARFCQKTRRSCSCATSSGTWQCSSRRESMRKAQPDESARKSL
jgi:hypothetical protein